MSVKKRKRNRLGMLLVGMFFGIIVGISIMYWATNLRQTSWFSFQKAYHYVQKLFPGDGSEKARTDLLTENTGTLKEKNRVNPLDTIPYDADSLGSNDSMDQSGYLEGLSSDYYIPEEMLPDSLKWFGHTLRGRLNNDSLQGDTVRKSRQKLKETILRDKFLQARVLIIKGKNDSLTRKKTNIDSLLTDDKMTLRLESNKIKVELWKSPVNYKGYKLTGNKLILFGIDNFDKLSIEYINKKIYVHIMNNYYLIEKNDDFRPLTPARKTEIVLNSGH